MSSSRKKTGRGSAAVKGVSPVPSPVVKPSRAIDAKTTLFLHVRAAGRCEFDNCNEYLLEHEPTGTPGNYAERAHMWAFSVLATSGARSWASAEKIHHHRQFDASLQELPYQDRQ